MSRIQFRYKGYSLEKSLKKKMKLNNRRMKYIISFNIMNLQ